MYSNRCTTTNYRICHDHSTLINLHIYTAELCRRVNSRIKSALDYIADFLPYLWIAYCKKKEFVLIIHPLVY